MKKNIRIAIWAPYPFGVAPGQRFRYEQYLHELNAVTSGYTIYTFLDDEAYGIFYKKGYAVRKAFFVIKGFLKRIIHTFSSIDKDYVFLFREAAPLGPPVFERVLAKVFRKKIIYDFDDAIWLPQSQQDKSIKTFFRNPHKVDSIIKWSYKISAGNAYLCNHARQFNTNIVLNPTTIDTSDLHNRMKDQRTDRFVIGWTGSHSTLMYLEPMMPVIRKLEQKYNFELVVISNQKPSFESSTMKFIRWNSATEINDLLQFNIGLMPLTDDAWTQGKCGFKALQYMALGIPALVSPVGVNTSIVTHGEDGFICASEEDWYNYIVLLINDPKLREEMGKKARIKIEKNYSVHSNKENFLQLFS